MYVFWDMGLYTYFLWRVFFWWLQYPWAALKSKVSKKVTHTKKDIRSAVMSWVPFGNAGQDSDEDDDI